MALPLFLTAAKRTLGVGQASFSLPLLTNTCLLPHLLLLLFLPLSGGRSSLSPPSLLLLPFRWWDVTCGSRPVPTLMPCHHASGELTRKVETDVPGQEQAAELEGHLLAHLTLLHTWEEQTDGTTETWAWCVPPHLPFPPSLSPSLYPLSPFSTSF